MEELMLTLLLWINQNTGLNYDVDDGLPAVVRLEQRQLARQILERTTGASEFKSLESVIVAYYDNEHRTIYLGESIDPDTVYGKSALLHELVHFVQYRQGVADRAPCIAALERTAYRLQARYLQTHGREPPFDEFSVAVRSLCQTR